MRRGQYAVVSSQGPGVSSQELEFIPCILCIPWFISTTNSIFAAAPTRNKQTQNFGVLSFINRSNSTIVFNQQHRWVTHRPPSHAKKLSDLTFMKSHISASPPRTSLIVKANNAITVIPPTPSSNPNSLYPNSGGTTHRTTHKRTQYPPGRGKEVQKIYNSGTRFK